MYFCLDIQYVFGLTFMFGYNGGNVFLYIICRYKIRVPTARENENKIPGLENQGI